MGWLYCFCAEDPRRVKPQIARYVYSCTFLVTNLVAWVVRDFSQQALSKLHYLNGCKGGHDCLGAEGVLRVSFGCFIFHFVMCLTTAGTKKAQDFRAKWHSGHWLAKCFMWIVSLALPFMLPPTFIQVYGEVARFGAGLFLLIQLVSVVKFITWWNDHWMYDNSDQCRTPAIIISMAAYTTAVSGIILMYIFYAPTVTCSLNIFFITWTLILLQIITGISLHSKANSGMLASGIMGLYIVFLCWSALRSEPSIDNCNFKKEPSTKGDWITIASFVIAVLAIAMAAFSAGTKYKLFQFKASEIESEDDVPYGYGFFHLVFATAAMYFAMLFVGWSLHQTMEKWSIDIGWASTWVKIVNEWLAGFFYIWLLVSPFVKKEMNCVDMDCIV